MSEPETWVIPVTTTTDGYQLQSVVPLQPEADWLTRVQTRQAEAYCVATDHEVFGPYASWEEAQSLLDEGVDGDVLLMTYR